MKQFIMAVEYEDGRLGYVRMYFEGYELLEVQEVVLGHEDMPPRFEVEVDEIADYLGFAYLEEEDQFGRFFGEWLALGESCDVPSDFLEDEDGYLVEEVE